MAEIFGKPGQLGIVGVADEKRCTAGEPAVSGARCWARPAKIAAALELNGDSTSLGRSAGGMMLSFLTFSVLLH
jgi:hypothetical protein